MPADLLRKIDEKVKENRCQNTFSVFYADPTDNHSHRDDADKKIHTKPDVFVENLILIGIIYKYKRKVPERPEYAENNRCLKESVTAMQTVKGVSSPPKLFKTRGKHQRRNTGTNPDEKENPSAN